VAAAVVAAGYLAVAAGLAKLCYGVHYLVLAEEVLAVAGAVEAAEAAGLAALVVEALVAAEAVGVGKFILCTEEIF